MDRVLCGLHCYRAGDSHPEHPKTFETVADLGEFLFRITDNGGATADRYTVVFSDGDYLGLSGSPSHPQGVSMWGEGADPQVQADAVADGTEVDMAIGDLPPGLAEHILYRCNEGLSDFLERVEAKDTKVVAPTRDMAEVNDGLSTSLGEGIYDSPGGYMIRWDTVEADRGPFATAREVLLASLPDRYGLTGPEYHSSLDVGRVEPDATVLAAIAELESRVDSGPAPSA